MGFLPGSYGPSEVTINLTFVLSEDYSNQMPSCLFTASLFSQRKSGREMIAAQVLTRTKPVRAFTEY